MYWPPVESYLKEVFPVAVISIPSWIASGLHAICRTPIFTMLVSVSSVAPANTSNLAGTVLPAFTVLRTPPMSMGW